MGDLISRKATINTVINMRNRCDNDINDFYDLLIESFKVLPYIDGLQTPWIPISKGLPMRGKWVLVTRKWDGGDHFVVRDMKLKHSWFNDEIDGGKVIAWMPLPEPYEEGEG